MAAIRTSVPPARNPWLDLPGAAPFVLPCDKPAVDVFNQTSTKKDLMVETGLLPEPFIGRTDAQIVVLALNPGLSARDAANHRRPAFRQRLLSGLRQEPSQYPFHYLDPAEKGPGADWWCRTAKALLGATSRESLSRGLLCLEFFPYHSRRFGHAHVRLPSQLYTFALLQSAIDRGAVIIMLRGDNLWYGAVPALFGYPNLHGAKNRRAASISPGNCPEGYAAALAELGRLPS